MASRLKRHCHWDVIFALTFRLHLHSHPLSYLPWLELGLVPNCQRYYEGSDSSGIASKSAAPEVSLLISIELPNIPSPTTLVPSRDARFIYRYVCFHRRRRRTTPAEIIRHPELGHIVDHCAVRGSRYLPARSPTGLAETSSLDYGLFIHLWLLPTLSYENAVTVGYGGVTTPPVRTCTRPFNRIHRRTGHKPLGLWI
jgi:hypothetical protein